MDAVKEKLLIKWKDKPQARRQCRRTYKAGDDVRAHDVRAVAVCRDGSRLAYAALTQVVVRDFRTGFVVSQMTGHSNTVSSVHFSPDGTRLVTGSYDKTVKIWNPATGEELCQLRGHTDRVSSVCFSPDGAKIVSGSWDEKVLIWDAASGEHLCSLKVDNSVGSIAYSPDGSKLAAAHYKTVSIFNMETNEVLCTVSGHRYVPFPIFSQFLKLFDFSIMCFLGVHIQREGV